jgi:hypothetical protein
MIIDIHGQLHHRAQGAGDGAIARSPASRIRPRCRRPPRALHQDDELRESIERNQLRLMHARGST